MNQPTFAYAAGQRVVFNIHRDEPTRLATVLRPCTYGSPDAEGSTAHYECDYEVGPMYRITLDDGTVVDAFEAELSIPTT